jgi:BirA family biotin operon repressor/biotin-[acetyl-CoA-carboxylase] ligase
MNATKLISLIHHDCRLLVLRSVDSTNNEARRQLAASSDLIAGRALGSAQNSPRPRPLVIIAENQTAGRGCQGHLWVSPPGGIYLSVLWTSAATPQQAANLPLVATLAARKALSAYSLPQIRIKWPNDLLTPDGKLAGILVENTEAQRAWVIGIGVNVSKPLSGGFTGAAYLSADAQIEVVAAALVDELLTRLDQWEQAGCDPALYEAEFRQYLWAP